VGPLEERKKRGGNREKEERRESRENNINTENQLQDPPLTSQLPCAPHHSHLHPPPSPLYEGGAAGPF